MMYVAYYVVMWYGGVEVMITLWFICELGHSEIAKRLQNAQVRAYVSANIVRVTIKYYYYNVVIYYVIVL